jgi:adenylate kinase
MKILMAGLPGSGKTTQAGKLEKELGIPLLRTGDIFRDISEEDSELGQKVKQVVESGGLVDDDLVVEIVKKALEDEKYNNGFVMDGYPRTVEQIGQYDPEFDFVFYLELSEQEIRNRLKHRGRVDDSPETITHRLITQEENMWGVLGYYKFKHKAEVHEINGERTVEEIHAKIREFLGND